MYESERRLKEDKNSSFFGYIRWVESSLQSIQNPGLSEDNKRC